MTPKGNCRCDPVLGDLDKEIAYAAKESELYAAVFANFRQLLDEKSSVAIPDVIEGVRGRWANYQPSAWFERPLLLAAALHRVVRSEEYKALIRFYPSMGGRYARSDVATFCDTMATCLRRHPEPFLRALQHQSLQTNEVSRGITWLMPMAEVWAKAQGEIGLVELGCSAGLNLVADHYAWTISGRQLLGSAGAPAISINLDNRAGDSTAIISALQELPKAIRFRMGCDLHIPNTRLPDDREMLEAMIWGDNPARLARLQSAMELQSRFLNAKLLMLEEADALAYTEAAVTRLAGSLSGGGTVCLFNTVVTCYFDDEKYVALRNKIATSFSRELKAQRCIWIEHEPPRRDERGLCGSAFQSVVRVHQLDPRGALSTTVIAGTEMHPRTYCRIKTV